MIPGTDFQWFLGGGILGVVVFAIWTWYRYRDVWGELG